MSRMTAGEIAWICALARGIVHPGLRRPIKESHQAVGLGIRPLPGSQNMGSEQMLSLIHI